jgi:BA14K-like protein
MLRLRTLAAAALLFAGLTLGFVLGRMSVWLFSSPGHDRPAQLMSERSATTPAPQAASPAAAPSPGPTASPLPAQQPAAAPSPTVAPVAAPAPASGAAPADPAAAGTQEPPKPVVAPNGRAAAVDPPGSASSNDEETERGPRIKLINPSRANPAGGPAGPERKADVDPIEGEADRQGLAACERRYSSFRRSDGTYQPFGGGPRQRCPLLR